MYETTVGSLSSRRLEYSYSSQSPFTDTVIFQPNTPSRGKSPKFSHEYERASFTGRRSNENGNRSGRREYLGSDEEMDELSDSRSSNPTSSRPVTPLQHPFQQQQQTSGPFSQIFSTYTMNGHLPQQLNTIRSRSTSPPNLEQEIEGENVVFTLAHKAERILGLVPGTLGYAKACLENAKDEIRRLSEAESEKDISISNNVSGQQAISQDQHLNPNQNTHTPKDKKTKLQQRARKAISFTGFNQYTSPSTNTITSDDKQQNRIVEVPNVILGQNQLNNSEEIIKREKRRKAVDGVIYWQREIQRLEDELKQNNQ
ncbi:uncharacterized protein L201_001061 [Kwoniella dendrophila CBS 6074]|uniref:Uncharacterized protein n=1 Tax=Kwoniella dendrophila CBS 6074 TaxID=1295534 RepID=A0AAX4JP18_9TREE